MAVVLCVLFLGGSFSFFSLIVCFSLFAVIFLELASTMMSDVLVNGMGERHKNATIKVNKVWDVPSQ